MGKFGRFILKTPPTIRLGFAAFHEFALRPE
jgi:hypothetical protein